jgi:hypothetical protein
MTSRNSPCPVMKRRAVTLAYSAVSTVVPDAAVIETDVVGDALIRKRRSPSQYSRLLKDQAERGQVSVEDHGLDHLLEEGHVDRFELANQPVIEERDSASGTEQVVARMRIAVKGMEAIQTAEHEAEERLGSEVLLGLRPRLHLSELNPVGQLRAQHPVRTELGDD